MKPSIQPSADEVGALLELAKVSLRGRTATFSDTPEGLRQFKEKTEEYFSYLQTVNSQSEDGQNILIPDIESLCVYLGISRVTLFHYENRHGAFGEYVSRLKDAICCVKKELALRNKLSSVLCIFDLTNNHGYLNSNEFHLITDNVTDTNQSALPKSDDYFNPD